MMKKIQTWAAVFAGMSFGVIAAALVLAGCSNPLFEKPQEAASQEAAAELPAGLGAVRVIFTQGEARTVMPAPVLGVLHLKYLFTKGAEPEVEKSPADGVFTLEPGDYTLRVEAYVDPDKILLAAGGSSASFTINAGVMAQPVNVTLSPIVSEGTGSLEFSLTYPAGSTVEYLTLTPIAGGVTLDLKAAGTVSGNTLSGTKSVIPSGYYLIETRMGNGAGAYAGKSEVAHIYQNLTTRADYTFTADNFRIYTITFALGEGGGTAPASRTVNAGTAINLPGQGGMTAPVDKTFAGWSNGTQTLVAGASCTVNDNITFTAQWAAPGPGISLSPDIWNTNTLSGSTQYYSFTALAGVSYMVTWDDSYQGSNNYTGDIIVSAYRGSISGTPLFSNVDSGYTSPRTIAAYSSISTVILAVNPYSNGGSGTYRIKYYPASSSSDGSTIPLSPDIWYANTLSGNTQYYSFTALAGSSYRVTWDDGFNGSGNYTGDIKVSAYRGSTSETSLFSNIDSGYTSPQTIAAYSSTSTIILAVSPYTNGTYRIKYYPAAPSPYTVTFAPGEGGGTAPASQTANAETTIALPGQGGMTAPANKTFAGWNDGTQTFQAEVSYRVNANIVLTAQWVSVITGTVSVTGTAIVGQTLTANIDGLDGEGTPSYQWKRGEVSIGLNSQTYTLTAADAGFTITVTVSRAGYGGSVSSDPTAAVIPLLTGTVSITGTAAAGRTLTANIDGLDGEGTPSYQWKRGEASIGVDSQTYTLTAADVGSTITVTVSRDGYEGSIISAPSELIYLWENHGGNLDAVIY
jgi:hypothetical protein